MPAGDSRVAAAMTLLDEVVASLAVPPVAGGGSPPSLGEMLRALSGADENP